MKGNKILAIIGLIAFAGFLWMACESSDDGGKPPITGEEEDDFNVPIGVVKENPPVTAPSPKVQAPPTKTPEQILAMFNRDIDPPDNEADWIALPIKDAAGKIIGIKIIDTVSVNEPFTSAVLFELSDGAEIKTNGHTVFLQGEVKLRDGDEAVIAGNGKVVIAGNSAIEGSLVVGPGAKLVIQDAALTVKNEGTLTAANKATVEVNEKGLLDIKEYTGLVIAEDEAANVVIQKSGTLQLPAIDGDHQFIAFTAIEGSGSITIQSGGKLLTGDKKYIGVSGSKSDFEIGTGAYLQILIDQDGGPSFYIGDGKVSVVGAPRANITGDTPLVVIAYPFTVKTGATLVVEAGTTLDATSMGATGDDDYLVLIIKEGAVVTVKGSLNLNQPGGLADPPAVNIEGTLDIQGPLTATFDDSGTDGKGVLTVADTGKLLMPALTYRTSLTTIPSVPVGYMAALGEGSTITIASGGLWKIGALNYIGGRGSGAAIELAAATTLVAELTDITDYSTGADAVYLYEQVATLTEPAIAFIPVFTIDGSVNVTRDLSIFYPLIIDEEATAPVLTIDSKVTLTIDGLLHLGDDSGVNVGSVKNFGTVIAATRIPLPASGNPFTGDIRPADIYLIADPSSGTVANQTLTQDEKDDNKAAWDGAVPVYADGSRIEDGTKQIDDVPTYEAKNLQELSFFAPKT